MICNQQKAANYISLKISNTVLVQRYKASLYYILIKWGEGHIKKSMHLPHTCTHVCSPKKKEMGGGGPFPSYSTSDSKILLQTDS